MYRTTCAVLLSLLLAACAAQSTQGPPNPAAGPGFVHGNVAVPKPWSHENFDNDAGKFTFAIFSDLTGGERDGVFSVAAAQLGLLRPEFVINVGDLIEGSTEDRQQLAAEWESFDGRSQAINGPLFYVGGNHDLINPVQWDVWSQRHGPRYYHFRYKDVLFLVLDTEDTTAQRQQEIYEARKRALERVAVEGWGIFGETEYASKQEAHTGTISAKQASYFHEVINEHPDVRWTFVFLHKPAWLKEGEQNFLAIEEALSGRSYTVFNGHNHAYVYRTRRGRDYIQLATTGGVHLEGKGKTVDHVTLVTVSDSGVDIANVKLAGIFDKHGNIPLDGNEICLENCWVE